MATELDASVGMSVAETTYGTGVTATKFFEFTDESFDWNPTFSQGEGMRVASRFPRAGRRAQTPVKQQITGDFTVEACSKGLGALLMAALGVVVSTQRGATSVYQHNFTPVTTDKLPSYTIQKGIPPVGGGATNPHTFPGMVCSQLEIDCPNSDIVKVKTTWNGRSVATATAYAAPSYPTPIELFEFQEGSIVIGGSPTAPTTTALATGGTAVASIRDFNLLFDNMLDDGGFNFGSAGLRARVPQIGGGTSGVGTGKMTAEYWDNTLRDAYLGQTDLGLILTFIGSTNIGSGSDHPALSIYIPNIRLEGELPKAAGDTGVPVTQSIGYTILDNLAATPLTISYVSTDTTP